MPSFVDAPDDNEAAKAAALAKRAALTDRQCKKLKRELDITQYLHLGMKVAWKFYRGHFELLGGLDDVQQLVSIGLIEARDHWDPRRGSFAMAAALYVRAMLNKEIEPAQRREGIAAQDRMRGRYLAKRGRVYKRAPSQRHSYKLISADAPISARDGAEGGTVLDTIAAGGLSPEEALIEKQERTGERGSDSARVREALAQLDPRQRRVIEARYGHENEPVVHRELGRELGISGTRVQQIEKKALERVRKALAGKPIRRRIDTPPVPPPKAPRPPKKAPKPKPPRAVRRRPVAWERDPITREQVPIRWEVY
jgi:RNA polymerase sigma factor (sigma-70 family)